MTVSKLIECLQGCNPSAEIILQKDAEGNGYSSLCGCETGVVYVPQTTWSGDVYSLEWSAHDAGMPAKEWRNIKKMPQCVVLFPIN